MYYSQTISFKNIYYAKLAEETSRYEDLIEIITNVIKNKNYKICKEELLLFSNGYKNVIGSLRASWRMLTSLLIDSQTTDNNSNLIQEYRERIELLIQKHCKGAINVVNKLLQNTSSFLDEIYYNKLNGDYHRYLAEHYKGESLDKSIEEAERCYEKSMKLCKANLKAIDEPRLNLGLNYSVFLYEIKKEAKQACLLAKETFDLAMLEIDDITQEEEQEATMLLQLLRDNLTIWTLDYPGENK